MSPFGASLTLIRLFEELRALGYEGGYDAVRRYARSWSREHASTDASPGAVRDAHFICDDEDRRIRVWRIIRVDDLDGHADFTSEPISVQDCSKQPPVAPPIALHFWGALKKQNVVEFIVHNYDVNGNEVSAGGPATYNWPSQ